jgi:hypothetical protein
VQEKKTAEKKSSVKSSYKDRGFLPRPTDLYEGMNFKFIRPTKPHEFEDYKPTKEVKHDFNYAELQPFWRHRETNKIYREKDGRLIGKITKDGFTAYEQKN